MPEYIPRLEARLLLPGDEEVQAALAYVPDMNVLLVAGRPYSLWTGLAAVLGGDDSARAYLSQHSLPGSPAAFYLPAVRCTILEFGALQREGASRQGMSCCAVPCRLVALHAQPRPFQAVPLLSPAVFNLVRSRHMTLLSPYTGNVEGGVQALLSFVRRLGPGHPLAQHAAAWQALQRLSLPQIMSMHMEDPALVQVRRDWACAAC